MRGLPTDGTLDKLLVGSFNEEDCLLFLGKFPNSRFNPKHYSLAGKLHYPSLFPLILVRCRHPPIDWNILEELDGLVEEDVSLLILSYLEDIKSFLFPTT